MKKSAIDKAIDQLQGEINLKLMVMEQLVRLQVKPKAKRGPRAVPGTDAKQAS